VILLLVVTAKRKASSREGMVVTTVALPLDLHRRLAIVALDEHAAIAEIIREAILRYLDAQKKPSGWRPR